MNYFYPIFLTACLLLAACSKEEHTGEEVDPLPPIEEMVAISFNSTIELETKAEGETAADASQTLAEGVLVDVYAYKQDAIAIPTKPATVKRRYKIGTGGAMDLAEGEDGIMYLPAGNYSFYALSANANTAPPALAQGSNSETAQLSNNTDYIYSAQSVTIDSKPGETQNVSLPFGRLSTRIEIKIVNGGSGDDKVVAAENPSLTFAATDPTGSKISLGANPLIAYGTPATTNLTTIQCNGTLTDGFTASYIMLPMQGKQQIPVSLKYPSITFNGLEPQKDKIYELNITTPDEGFVSGKQYNYKVNISGNDVVFKGVTVTAWTGKPGNLPNDNITEDF